MSNGPMPVCMMPSVPATPPENDSLRAVGVVVVHARVELRLRRALVAEGGIGACARRCRPPGDRTGSCPSAARSAILRVAAGRDLVRQAIVDRLRVRAADVEQRACTRALSPGGAIEAADAEHGARALHLARRLGDHVDDAVERVGAPDGGGRAADHFDLLDLVEVHRQEVPHDEAEEVLIEAAAVEQRELPGRQRAGRAAAS